MSKRARKRRTADAERRRRHSHAEHPLGIFTPRDEIRFSIEMHRRAALCLIPSRCFEPAVEHSLGVEGHPQLLRRPPPAARV